MRETEIDLVWRAWSRSQVKGEEYEEEGTISVLLNEAGSRRQLNSYDCQSGTG